jgi:hypothetical protein
VLRIAFPSWVGNGVACRATFFVYQRDRSGE